MQSPPALRNRRTLIASLVILLIVCAGSMFWWRHAAAFTTEDVSAFLSRSVGGDRIRFSALKIETLSQGEAERRIMVAATARTIEPFYTKIDVTEYMNRTLQLGPEVLPEARRVLANEATRQASFSDAAPFPADPYQAVLLRVTAPAGTALNFNGVLAAHRDNGAWKFALVSGGFEGSGAQGETRSAFGTNSYVVGEAGDETRLRSLVTDFEAFGGRVAGIVRNLESSRAAERRRVFLAQIAPGRIFQGTAVEAGTRRETPLYLEIVGPTSENEVKAVLRNDNSWHITRSFLGTWSADEKFENPILTLASVPTQAVRNAGPFLENAQLWKFTLRVDSKGELTEQNRLFQYRFQPITPEQVAAVQARLEGEFDRAVAATEPGLLYLGTAISKTSGASEPVFLRFSPRSQGNESVEAAIESTIRAWKRPLHGTIMTNVRRSEGAPIRLRSASNEAVEEAASGSVLADPRDLNLRLGLEQGTLVGGDERFSYRFAVAVPADLERLEASRIERVRRLDAVTRNGIVFDGNMREDRGYVFRTRLEFTRVDRQAGVITARFRSLNRTNVFREFLGTWDPAGDSIVLNSTDRGEVDKNFGFNVPFFVTRDKATLRLTLHGNSITGRIAGEPRWAMDFPTEAFLSAPTEGPTSVSPLNDGSVFPTLPKAEGAYLLSNGSWVPLPANHGHIVAEPLPKLDEDEEAARTLRALKGMGGDELAEQNTKGKNKEKETIPYLEFDGKEARPLARGSAVVLLFIGSEPTGNPALELAPAQTLADGRRRIKLVGRSPVTAVFGEQRVAAYVRRIASNSFLLTTTSTLSPGSYILNAGVGYEFIRE